MATMAGITIPCPPVRRTNDEEAMVITSPPRRRTLDDARFILVIGKTSSINMLIVLICFHSMISYILTRRIYYPGGPGSGKSTICARLAADLDLIHLDLDAMLLDLEEYGPEGAAAVVTAAREEGRPVPVGLIMTLLMEKIHRRVEKGDCTFLLDGFPGSISDYFHCARVS